MVDLNKIKKPVEEDMRQFESFFFSTMKSDIPFLRLILNNIIRRKGKQMRPLLVFLCAAVNGQINRTTHVAATLIELLHTASLVHDDVVDEADERRGFPTINALWNSKIAVLLGDFLLAKGLLISIDNNCFDILHIVSDAVQSMAEGELTEIQKVRKYNITEEEYLKIISGKTASLIAACAATGTRSVTEDASVIRNMHDMGKNIGIAFQIRDDILDFSDKSITGKTTSNDIKEGKLTLPLIYSLQSATLPVKHHIISIIRKKEKTKQDIDTVTDFVLSNDGIIHAEQKMNLYRDKALQYIDSYPYTDYKNALEEFISFTASRNK